MELSEEMTKRILSVFENNSKVMDLVAAGDITALFWYVHEEANKCSIPVLKASDIVQACENLDFEKLRKLYFTACYHFSNREPLNIEESSIYYRQSNPDANEDEVMNFIEYLKQSESRKERFLKEVIDAFRSLNLQGLYAQAKRHEEVVSLCGDLARLERLSRNKPEFIEIGKNSL